MRLEIGCLVSLATNNVSQTSNLRQLCFSYEPRLFKILFFLLSFSSLMKGYKYPFMYNFSCFSLFLRMWLKKYFAFVTFFMNVGTLCIRPHLLVKNQYSSQMPTNGQRSWVHFGIAFLDVVEALTLSYQT